MTSSRARSSLFNDAAAGEVYNGTVMVAPGATGAFRLPDFEPNEFAEMCNREYQEAGGDTYTATDPETNSAYGATTGMCTFIRVIARAVEAAGPNPTREDLAAAVEGLGAIDTGLAIPGSFGPGKYTAPNALNMMTVATTRARRTRSRSKATSASSPRAIRSRSPATDSAD